MTKDEAINVLEAIQAVYPKFEVSKKKARMLIPQLQKMEYTGVMNKLSAFIAAHRYVPTTAEIAVFPKEDNVYLEKMEMWETEAAKVPEETKEKFKIAMQQLLVEKTYD